MKPKELIKILELNGWYEKNQEGSHKHFIHKDTKKKVQIPMHNKDLKKGTLNAILKQAGLK